MGTTQSLRGLPCPARRVTRARLPVPRRPFIKLKENGRANISRSSSSTSSFSSTAGEGEALEECDSGVGVACPTLGGAGTLAHLLCAWKWLPWAEPRPGSGEKGALWKQEAAPRHLHPRERRVRGQVER